MEPVKVSVIIPCYNEEGTIEELLSAILAQTYPVDRLEVIIADGLSTDRTRERISRFKDSHPQLYLIVVENHQRTIPAALNQAIAASTGKVLSRMDAHAIPAPDYIEKCLTSLNAGQGENVGGVIDIRPGSDTWIGRAISVATAHPLGVGDARYRTATKAGEADTVAFGTYRRELVDRIGGYDETLRINEDYEFNTRVRRSGGKIWVDPAIRIGYYSRPDLRSLAKQYFAYGYWKFKMLKRHPDSLRWRQALPPVFVSGILMLSLLSTFWVPARILLAGVAGLYLVILLAGSIKPAIMRKRFSLIPGVPLAIMTMHFSWGSGFLWSLMKELVTGSKNGH